MRETRNVFEEILKMGHDEEFVPTRTKDFLQTDAAAGSREKIEVMAQRALRGEPIMHEEDRSDYSNLVGAIRPRD